MSLLTKVLQYSNVIKIEWTWISTWDCHICNAFLVTSHCELHRKDGLHACGQVLYQQEGEVDGTGEGGWEEGEVGGVTCRVLCTWWQLGLALKSSLLRLG